VSIGMPAWSPTGEWIAFLVAHAPTTGLVLIRPDGSERRPIGPSRGWHASWSRDGQWLYYATPDESGLRQEKAHVDNGEISIVYDNVTGRATPPDDGSTFVFTHTGDQRLFGRWSGESEVVTIQRDGTTRSLAPPLTDFGNRAILIARSVSWAGDSKSIYAAVAEVEADIVLFDGLLD